MMLFSRLSCAVKQSGHGVPQLVSLRADIPELFISSSSCFRLPTGRADFISMPHESEGEAGAFFLNRDTALDRLLVLIIYST